MSSEKASRERTEAIVQKFVDESRAREDKYDEAIAYLNEMDAGQGSYLGEIAELIQELLGRVYEVEAELAAGRGEAEEISPELKAWQEKNKAQQAGYLRQMGERAKLYYARERELGRLPPSDVVDGGK